LPKGRERPTSFRHPIAPPPSSRPKRRDLREATLLDSLIPEPYEPKNPGSACPSQPERSTAFLSVDKTCPPGTLVKHLTKPEFIELAREYSYAASRDLSPALQSLLELGYEYPRLLNKKAGILLSENSSTADIKTYLSEFTRSYLAAREKTISFSPSRTTPDSALDIVMEVFGNVARSDLRRASELHRIAMTAENTLGTLLETYLANIFEPRGWLWCCGNIVRAVDFFKPGTPAQLLQVKNRSNSENSSSSAIREFLREGIPTNITKWYRIRAGDGRTCWENLPGNDREQIADERRFIEFIQRRGNRRS
jgi:hypothetical protein